MSYDPDIRQFSWLSHDT